MQKIDDEILVYQIEEANDYFYNLLIKKYTPIFKRFANRILLEFNIKRYEPDDFMVEFIESINIAIRKYNYEKGTSFRNYFLKILDHKIRRSIVEEKNSNDAFHRAISLDHFICDGVALIDSVSDERDNADVPYLDDSLDLIVSSIDKDKDSLAMDIILARYKGYTYKEISIMYNVPVHQVRRTYLHFAECQKRKR